jgi:hypothetical protein
MVTSRVGSHGNSQRRQCAEGYPQAGEERPPAARGVLDEEVWTFELRLWVRSSKNVPATT